MEKVAHTLSLTGKFAAHPLNIFPSETALKQNVLFTLADEQQAQTMDLHSPYEQFMFNLSSYGSGVEDNCRRMFHFDATVEKLMQKI